MPRTLIVDTNRAAVPIYHALCAMGHDVWVVGGKPTETLAKLAKNFVQLDYSDSSQLATFVDDKGFDFLVPGCTDLSYQVCSVINDGHFPGIDTPANQAIINSKRKFREIATELGLSVPKVLSLKQAADVESVIVKPVDSFSGRGITVLHKPDKCVLNHAFETACKASPTGDALIEQFVQGQLFSHSAFVWDSEVIADFIVQEDCTTNPFTVDTSRVVQDFSEEMIQSLRAGICRLSKSLHLMNGLIHTQFIVHGDCYWIIEMTRRCPGDIYSLLIEFSTGYPYAANYVAPFIGKKFEFRNTSVSRERIIRHTVTSKEGTSLWGLQFSLPVHIRLFVPLAASGDYIGPSPAGRAGIFFFSSQSKAEHDNLYCVLLDGKLYSFPQVNP